MTDPAELMLFFHQFSYLVPTEVERVSKNCIEVRVALLQHLIAQVKVKNSCPKMYSGLKKECKKSTWMVKKCQKMGQKCWQTQQQTQNPNLNCFAPVMICAHNFTRSPTNQEQTLHNIFFCTAHNFVLFISNIDKSGPYKSMWLPICDLLETCSIFRS